MRVTTMRVETRVLGMDRNTGVSLLGLLSCQFSFPTFELCWFAQDPANIFSFSVFLSVAAYLIFGSWLNYNRYGARGWDLVPHGDNLRDIPYIFQDWFRRVVNSLSGSGSRGGYSAV